jgi:hypothetical protein
MTSNNTLLYVGKSYVPTLPSSFWQMGPVSSTNELLQLTCNLITSNQYISNAAATNVSIEGISFIDGGYYFVNVTFTNGYLLQAAFLRYNIMWYTIYGNLIPPIQSLMNNTQASNGLPTLTLMTSNDISNDTNFNSAYQSLYQDISSNTNGYKLSKI